jgi:hypothetical protein
MPSQNTEWAVPVPAARSSVCAAPNAPMPRGAVATQPGMSASRPQAVDEMGATAGALFT